MRVLVHLPYDGGGGPATIIELHAEGPSWDRRATVVVCFDPDHGPSFKHDRREIRPRDVVRPL